MSRSYRPYVPVAQRRSKAAKKVAALQKKGASLEPVTAATARGKIAASFWGQAWCDHLESYSDFANRLPRGRTYLRNGSVLHLGIEKGAIRALVMGSSLYEQIVRIDPLPPAPWQALQQRCQGRIGSLVELLQGNFSDEIMKLVTDRQNGLFPSPEEIHLDCNCPDWADLCKHLAAVLYGVGARLDERPELLFRLRGVDQAELVQADASSLVTRSGSGTRRRRLSAEAVGDVFGVEMVPEDSPERDAAPPETAAAPTTPADASPPTRTNSKQPARGGAKKAAAKAAAQKTAKKRAKSVSQKKVAADPANDGEKIALAHAYLDRMETAVAASSPERPPRKTASPFTPTGTAIRQLREQLGLSRRAFARELGVSAPTIANWEAQPGPLHPHARNLAALQRLHDRSQTR